MMTNIQNLSAHLQQSADGIWRAKTNIPVSYTENGHNIMRELEDKSFWYRHRENIIQAMIADSTFDFLLDIGGGNGNISRRLLAQGMQVVLLEPGDSGARHARQQGVEHVIQCSLQEAELIPACVPAVGLFDVLEHVENDDIFLKEIFVALQTHGRLFITVPAHPFLYSDFDREVGHYRRYTLKQLRRILQQAGFDVLYSSYFFACIPLPLLLIRNVRQLFGIKTPNRDMDHLKNAGLLSKIVGACLKPELFFIKRRWRIPVGSSCLIIARKPA